MDRYFEAMVQVSYGIVDPKVAVERVESGASGVRQLLESVPTDTSDDSIPSSVLQGLRQLVSSSQEQSSSSSHSQ